MSSIRTATPLVLAIGLALSACQQPAVETGEMEETPSDTVVTVSAEEQLDVLRTDYEQAWNARDMDAIVAMLTPEYHEIGAEGSYGHAEVVAMMKDIANLPPEGATMSIETKSLEVAESGDVAYGTGTTTITFPGADGEETAQITDWIAGFKKVGDEWKLDRLATVPTTAESGMEAPAGENATETM